MCSSLSRSGICCELVILFFLSADLLLLLITSEIGGFHSLSALPPTLCLLTALESEEEQICSVIPIFGFEKDFLKLNRDLTWSLFGPDSFSITSLPWSVVDLIVHFKIGSCSFEF